MADKTAQTSNLVNQIRGDAAMHRQYKRDWSAELMERAASEIERLRAALLKYAEHLPGCTLRLGAKPQDEGCRCGLTELLWTGPSPVGRPSVVETPTSGWQSIETAPKDGRTLLLGYYNSAKKWRTMRGQWFKEGEMDEWDGDSNEGNPAGWYETCVENDDPPNCWWTDPTHWQPLPKPPAVEPPTGLCSAHREPDPNCQTCFPSKAPTDDPFHPIDVEQKP